MKKQILPLLAVCAFAQGVSAQCLTVTCPSSVSVNVDSNSCGAVVTYASPVMNSTCTGSLNDTFNYTGSMQTYVVPPGVTVLTIETWGAQGGANWVNNVNYGGYARADFAVTPGETLNIYVGGQPTTITGGFNGGGNGEGAGKGGGGASDVRQGGNTYNDRIIVAGGAGGAGYWSNLHVAGGVGGGLTGGNGYRAPDYATNPGGQGGTQTSSGTGTCVSFNNPSVAGGFGYGGAPSGCGCEGYGGGGGWWGGAGSGNCRGGGGGSGYILSSATNQSTASGVRVGHGMVVIGFSGSTAPTLTQTAGLASGSTFPVGTTTNTFLASDPFGNSQTCSFQVTVTDNVSPVITNIPTAILQANDSNSCGAIVSWSALSVIDNCPVTTTSNYNSGDMFPIGTTTVTYIAADSSGNSDTASFTVTVMDMQAPVITNIPSAITQANDSGSCGAIVSWSALSISDNCPGVIVTSNYNSGDMFPVGVTTVTYLATDSSGNSDSTFFTVTVTDMQSPVITNIPSAITQANDSGLCGAAVSWAPLAITDNCPGVIIASNYNSGDMFPLGTTTVVYNVTDSAGNSNTASFNVTVLDTEAPVFSSCPQDVSMCPGVLNYNTPIATDNCAATVSLISGPASGSSLTPGTYTVIYAATDSTGNSDSCSFTVTVNPNPVVTLTLGTPSVVCVDDGSYALSGGSPAGGVWSGNGVSGSSFSPATAGTGQHLVLYLFTDPNGCESSATDSISVSACVGIAENGTQVFSMYPNPASGAFTFTASSSGTLEMLDVNGQLIRKEQVANGKKEINLTGYAPGVYLVRFTSEAGNVSSGRLIIQR